MLKKRGKGLLDWLSEAIWGRCDMTNYEKIVSMSKNEMLNFLCEFLTDFDRSDYIDVKKWLEKESENDSGKVQRKAE